MSEDEFKLELSQAISNVDLRAKVVEVVQVWNYFGGLSIVFTEPDENGNATIIDCQFNRVEKQV